MMRALVSLFFALSVCLAAPANLLAQDANPVAQDRVLTPEVERKARNVGQKLRCVVCQNQSIEESDAQLAADMREVVRERLANGDTEAEVIAMMRDRYGDYVLLNPPMQLNTAILWLAPFALGFAVIWGVWRVSRQRSDMAAIAVPLSEDEQAKLAAMKRDLT